MNPRYLKMLEKMSRKAGSQGAVEWSVYVLRCADGTLYTGIAKDVPARLKKHNARRGAAYTRTRVPVELAHREDGFTRSQALVREAWIKRLPRDKKQKLLEPPRNTLSLDGRGLG